MKRKIYLLLLIPLVALTSCNNDDNINKAPIDQLPPPTQSGEYTFGCLVNGEPMIPNNTNYISAICQGGIFDISADVNKVNTGQVVNIIVPESIIVNESYDLTNYPFYIAKYQVFGSETTNCYYDFEDTFDGWIKFSKIDRINQIVSGTFEYSTVTENCDTIRVTNGRFDMPYTN